MKISIETDKDIASLHIVFSDNSNSKVEIVPKQEIVQSKSNSVDINNIGERMSNIPSKTTSSSPIEIPSVEGRPDIIDPEFSKQNF